MRRGGRRELAHQPSRPKGNWYSVLECLQRSPEAFGRTSPTLPRNIFIYIKWYNIYLYILDLRKTKYWISVPVHSFTLYKPSAKQSLCFPSGGTERRMPEFRSLASVAPKQHLNYIFCTLLSLWSCNSSVSFLLLTRFSLSKCYSFCSLISLPTALLPRRRAIFLCPVMKEFAWRSPAQALSLSGPESTK